jgi:hypothetical protein
MACLDSMNTVDAMADDGTALGDPVGSFLDVPGDIKLLRPWLPLVRRMRERGLSRGLSVLSVTVVTNAQGCPIAWLEPEVSRIEPRGNRTELTRLLESLAGQEEQGG